MAGNGMFARWIHGVFVLAAAGAFACAGAGDRRNVAACPPGARCPVGGSRDLDPGPAGGQRRGLEPRLDGLPLVAIPRAAPEVGRLRGSGSLSIGSATNGFVVRCRTMPREGAHHAVLAEHAGRGTSCATDDLVDGLLRAAAAVDAAAPGARLGIGNLGRTGGGDIPWSVSHNSGRDADLAFYLLDPDGKPLLPRTLVRLDWGGRGEADGVPVRFDVRRNWLLVKALLQDPALQVNWLFVSRPLRRAMLDFARRRKEAPALVRMAEEALAQPRRAKPHDDHLHLRISCPADDVLEGCRDTGTQRPWFRDPSARIGERVRDLLPLARAGDVQARADALTVLGRLGTAEARAEVLRGLEEGPAEVRRAAAAALADGGLEGAEGLVLERLARERDEAVIASLVAALDRHLPAWRRPGVLSAMLGLEGGWEVDLGVARVRRSVREWALAALGRQSPGSAVRGVEDALAAGRLPAASADDALRRLTGADPAPAATTDEDRAAAWRDWWRNRRERPAREWLAEALASRGVDTGDPEAVLRLADGVEKGGSRTQGPWIREAAAMLGVRLPPDGMDAWPVLLREAAVAPAEEAPPADDSGGPAAGANAGPGKAAARASATAARRAGRGVRGTDRRN